MRVNLVINNVVFSLKSADANDNQVSLVSKYVEWLLCKGPVKGSGIT